MASKLLRVSKNFATISQRFKSDVHRSDFLSALAAVKPTEQTVTSNNIKVACQTLDDVELTTFGFWVNAGPRYEEAHQNGITDLIRRVTVNDTKAGIEEIGGSVHSYTNREQTALYVTCFNKDVPKVFEILSGNVFNPKCEQQDIENEQKNLALESEDPNYFDKNAERFVMDYLHASAYQGTPLGQNVLGSTESAGSLKSKDVKDFIESNYKASRTVVAACGGVQLNELVQLAEKHLGKLDDTFDGEPPVLSTCRYTGSEIRHRDDSLEFAYIGLAVQGPGCNSPDLLPLQVAKIAMGAYDRTLGKYEGSKYDICHVYKPFNVTYSDTGLFGVYGICEKMQCQDFSQDIISSWQRVSSGITDAELNAAKNRLVTQLLKQQGIEDSCKIIGESVAAAGRRTPLNELVQSIENMSNQTVRDVVDKYITNKCLVVASIGPVEQLDQYVNLRIPMRWKLF